MKEKEREIIHHMRKGKRVNISKIARTLNLPISTVSDRIKRIEEKYVFKRSSLLDYSKVGYNANAILTIKVTPEKKPAMLDYLKENICFNSIFHTNTNHDFIVEIVCKDSMEMMNKIDEMKTIFPTEITPFQILGIEEKEKFVP